MSKIRPYIQFLFLLIFMVLMFTGRPQVWMGFIFLSILLSTFFGRFYCGWACPINTLIRPINWLKRKLGIKENKGIPSILKTGNPRLILFGFFLLGLGYTIYTITQGSKFPLPLIIIPLGLLTALFINEKAWHRYLCPWGVLFSLTGRFARMGLAPATCSGCSICKKNCPGDAITVDPEKGAVVDSTYCLLCFDCEANCPLDAYKYEKINVDQIESGCNLEG